MCWVRVGVYCCILSIPEFCFQSPSHICCSWVGLFCRVPSLPLLSRSCSFRVNNLCGSFAVLRWVSKPSLLSHDESVSKPFLLSSSRFALEFLLLCLCVLRFSFAGFDLVLYLLFFQVESALFLCRVVFPAESITESQCPVFGVLVYSEFLIESLVVYWLSFGSALLSFCLDRVLCFRVCRLFLYFVLESLSLFL